MSKRTPKNHKNSHNTPVVLCWHEKKIESNKRQWISFRPQRWDVPYRKQSCLLWEAPVCEKHIPKPAPNGTKFVPRHVDAAPCSMPSFMNFRRVLYLLEFKNQASQCFAGNQRCPVVWNSFPFLAWEPKHAPKDTDLIFQPIYMHWSMCM